MLYGELWLITVRENLVKETFSWKGESCGLHEEMHWLVGYLTGGLKTFRSHFQQRKDYGSPVSPSTTLNQKSY